MSAEYFHFAARRRMSKLSRPPAVLQGTSATGRIARLLVGQGYGFIRLRSGRDVFFHRADLLEGNRFNDLRPGDIVTFELLEDRVSGARALRVTRPSMSGMR
jgi:cold shock CspA family protein